MKIVVLDGATLNPGDNPWDQLTELGDVTIHDRSAPEEVVIRSEGAEVLVINKIRLGRETLQQLPQLRLIAVTATGYDCVDVAAASDQGIGVANVPEYGTDSVAQHTFALLLHLCHEVALHDRAVKEGAWQRSGNFCFWNTPLRELTGKTMGIVGWGRIGRRVGELAGAFGMRLLVKASERSRSIGDHRAEFADSLIELVAKSDVVSLHCPLTPETEGMIDRRLLSEFKSDAILINTARGALVVEQDLADALAAGQLGAAAVDVVSAEPIDDDNPLLSAPRCVVTPHLAWATLEARQRLMAETVCNVADFSVGKERNRVLPPA